MTRPYAVKSRGLFAYDSKEPFKISRSEIEEFVDRPRRFYLSKDADQIALATAQAKGERFSDEISALQSRISELGEKLQRKTDTLAEELTKSAWLDERNAALERQVGELRAQESKLQEISKAEFENIGARVLKANASELSDTSQKQIAAILDPLRELIQSPTELTSSAYRNTGE